MRHPSFTYANVMSTLGVFIALGGTSYAVARNSIGTPQLRNGAVTSAKVRNGTLTRADLARSAIGLRGPRGTAGPLGPLGPTGPVGPPGPAAAEAWKGLPFTNGWTNYGPPWETGGYRKDQLGVVHLRGLISQAAGAPTGGPIAILPPGYRPLRSRIFAVHTGETPHAIGRVQMSPDGQFVWSDGATGETDYTSLEGVAFETD